MVEQPVGPDDTETLRQLTATAGVPIFADEGLNSVAQIEALARHQSANGVMVKPARCGGLLAARALAEAGHIRGISTCTGSMRELGIATAAFRHLAAATPGDHIAADLAGPALFLVDDILVVPDRIADGVVGVPEGAGFGIEVDTQKLDRIARMRRDYSLTETVT